MVDGKLGDALVASSETMSKWNSRKPKQVGRAHVLGERLQREFTKA
jgi:hypothetical protein